VIEEGTASQIKQLVVTAGLETKVAGPDRTLFAPDGSAFAAIPAKLFFCNLHRIKL